MAMMPQKSEIILGYNEDSRYLARVIGSVRFQTFGDRELTVMDDASTDDTARLVPRIPQSRHFRQAGKGGGRRPH